MPTDAQLDGSEKYKRIINTSVKFSSVCSGCDHSAIYHAKGACSKIADDGDCDCSRFTPSNTLAALQREVAEKHAKDSIKAPLSDDNLSDTINAFSAELKRRHPDEPATTD